MEENIWQLITIAICIYILLGCRKLYRVPRIGSYALLLALPAFATAVFYALTALTDWSGGHEWSAPIRFFTYLMLAGGVNRMLKVANRG